MNSSDSTPFDVWAMVELFGHSKIAGRVSEQVVAGQGFVRVDVPALPADKYHPEQPAMTRLYGPGAIYSITPVSEEIAVRAAQSIRVAPVSIYMTMPQLSAGDDNDPDDDMRDFPL